jgi:SAM-dependent methyltransferase
MPTTRGDRIGRQLIQFERNVYLGKGAMGLARAAVHLMLTEAVKRPFSGSILTLGRQHVYVTANEVQSMATQLGVKLRPMPVELHREPSLSAKGYVSDDWLLRSLGFDQITRLDYSDYESSELIFDLNEPQTPATLSHQFDVVLDSGTLEHVFDFAAGLRHCVRAVREQGRIVHLTPSSNCVEHGFYSVSPTLFADFYAASGFKVDRVWLCEIPIDLPRGTWNVYDYLGSSQRFISLGQLSQQIWFTFAVVTASQGIEPRTPQQWIYTQTWSQAEEPASSVASTFEAGSKSEKLMQRLARFPRIQASTRQCILKWRKWRHAREIQSRQLPYPFIGKF